MTRGEDLNASTAERSKSVASTYLTRIFTACCSLIWFGSLFLLVCTALAPGIAFGLAVVFIGPWVAILSLIVGATVDPGKLERTTSRAKWFCALLTFVWLVGFPATLRRAARIGNEPPLDSALVASFDSNQDHLNRLARLLSQSKGINRVGPSWSDPPEDSCSLQQLRSIKEIRDTFDKIGLEGTLVRRGSVWLLPQWRTYFFLATHTRKGFAFASATPSPILPTLDAQEPVPGQAQVAFRRLKGSWYLYWEFSPG
ncbi:MAG: hypothetical protein WCK51_05200 [Armatimonadota bacterium]